VSDPHRNYEFRCPIHGFVKLNAWERDIVSHPAFPLCAKISETTTSSFITVEGEEEMDVRSHGKQWQNEPGGQ
jgi:hypothetical protein